MEYGKTSATFSSSHVFSSEKKKQFVYLTSTLPGFRH